LYCDKRSYQTPHEAAEDLVGLRARNHKHKFRVYECPICGLYHITTITKKILRPFKKNKYPIDIEREVGIRSEGKSKHKQKSKKKKNR
jgi:hypothetical protein